MTPIPVRNIQKSLSRHCGPNCEFYHSKGMRDKVKGVPRERKAGHKKTPDEPRFSAGNL